MEEKPTRVVLVGMPGAGKSAVGRALAAISGREFIDTDDVVEAAFGASLQALLQRVGPEGFKRLEQTAIVQHPFPSGAIVATGGSVIYSEAAMAALRALGPIVYLQVNLATIESRVANWDSRGFVKRPRQSLRDIFVERLPLYEAAADLIVPGDDRTPADIATRLAAVLALR